MEVLVLTEPTLFAAETSAKQPAYRANDNENTKEFVVVKYAQSPVI